MMMKFNPKDRSNFVEVDYLMKVKFIKLINRICNRKTINLSKTNHLKIQFKKIYLNNKIKKFQFLKKF